MSAAGWCSVRAGSRPEQLYRREQTGTENYTLLITEMPSHSHAPFTKTQPATANKHLIPVAGDYLTRFQSDGDLVRIHLEYAAAPECGTAQPNLCRPRRRRQPHENRQPYLRCSIASRSRGSSRRAIDKNGILTELAETRPSASTAIRDNRSVS